MSLVAEQTRHKHKTWMIEVQFISNSHSVFLSGLSGVQQYLLQCGMGLQAKIPRYPKTLLWKGAEAGHGSAIPALGIEEGDGQFEASQAHQVSSRPVWAPCRETLPQRTKGWDIVRWWSLACMTHWDMCVPSTSRKSGWKNFSFTYYFANFLKIPKWE